MATITPTDLRTKTQRSSFYLSVFQPVTLLTALVNDVSITRGARTVAYDTGSGSGFSTIEAYQLMEVDTATGTELVRVKAITGNQTSGTITIDENAIAFADNQVIRIKHFYPLVAVPPSIRNSIFYKFYNVTYSDQNSLVNPVAVIGSHLVGVLSAGSVAFSLNSSSSYAIAQGATISSRVWSCVHNGGGTTGVSFSNATVANPTLTITVADQYWLKCTVTDSNGKTQSTYRAIFVYSSLANAYKDFTVSNLTGDWQTGGWQCSISATGNVTLADFPDGALAVVHYQNYFNSTESYIDLWGTASQNIVMAGYIRKDQDNDQFDNGTGTVAFDLTTPDGVMDNMSELGSISLNAVASPSKWYQYASWMTCGRGVHHLLKWHSSVLETCDVLGLTDNTLGVKNIDFTEPSVLQMINSLGYQRGIFAKMVSSRLGRLYFVADSQMLNDTDFSALDTVFTLSIADISGIIDIVRQPEASVGTADLDGFSFNGSVSTPFISIMPGYRESSVSYGFPGYRGTGTMSTKSQVLNDQTDSNEKVGRTFAAANNNPLEIRHSTPANYLGAYDIVPSIGVYNWGLANIILVRDTDLNGRLLICRNISHQIDTQLGTIQTSVVYEPRAQGASGIQGNYPVGYPTAALRQPDWTPPNAGPLIIAFRDDSSTFGKARVVTVGSITLGALATFASSSVNWVSVCALSATKALVCYQDAGNASKGTAVVLSISGTTITPGTPVVFETGTTTHISCCAMSDGLAMVSYRDEGNTNKGTACALSVSGTTITAGSPVVYESDATLYCSITRLSATKAITCYRDNSTGFGTACVLDVSGTVITANTPDVFHAEAIVRTGCDTIDSTTVLVSCSIVSGTSLVAFVIYGISTGFSTGAGATLDNTRGAFDSTEPGDHWVRVANATTAIIVYQTDNFITNPFSAFAVPVLINSTNLVGGTPVEMGSYTNSNDEIVSCALVSGTKALIFYGDSATDGRVVTCDFTNSAITDNNDEVIANVGYTRYTSSATLQAVS